MYNEQHLKLYITVKTVNLHYLNIERKLSVVKVILRNEVVKVDEVYFFKVFHPFTSEFIKIGVKMDQRD
jgi:hypothetical protein